MPWPRKLAAKQSAIANSMPRFTLRQGGGVVTTFNRSLRPNCLDCHSPPDGDGYVKTGSSMATYDDLMQGSVFQAVTCNTDLFVDFRMSDH